MVHIDFRGISAPAVNDFSTQMSDMIIHKFRNELRGNEGRWVIIPATYIRYQNNVIFLARSLAGKLGIEVIQLERVGSVPYLYDSMSHRARKVALNKIGIYCSQPQKIQGKQISRLKFKRRISDLEEGYEGTG